MAHRVENRNEFEGQVAVVTGGVGVLGSAIACALARRGARVAIVDRDPSLGRVSELSRTQDIPLHGVVADVLDRASLERACHEVQARLGTPSLLVNAAGGNAPNATTKWEVLTDASEWEGSFFGLDEGAFRSTFDLNLMGTLLPTQVLGRAMVGRGGTVLNVSSMAASRPLTKACAYGAGKAAVEHFTRWLSVHLAKVGVRVNAMAPGFLVTHQNAYLLREGGTGAWTPRARRILDHTPMGRFGEPEDIIGPALFLLSDASKFITGAVLPVDGGFLAYGGV